MVSSSRCGSWRAIWEVFEDSRGGSAYWLLGNGQRESSRGIENGRPTARV
jgi:hypothetical protein